MVKRVSEEINASIASELKRPKQDPIVSDQYDSNHSDGAISDDSEDLMARAHEFVDSGSEFDSMNDDEEQESVIEQFSSDDEQIADDNAATSDTEVLKRRKQQEPTAQEIQELKESESLFKSNLFKFEMDELLQEVRVNYDKCNSLEQAVRKLKDILENIQDQPETEMHHIEKHLWSRHKITVPFPGPKPESSSLFAFRKPEKIMLVGSFMTRSVLKSKDSSQNVDMVVQMPRCLFGEKDHLNYTYFHKRAYFLAMLAAGIKSQDELKCEMTFEYFQDDILRPILVLRSSSGSFNFAKTKFSIRILLSIEPDVFKSFRLGPSRNNVRPPKIGDQFPDQSTYTPTPHYNNSILMDSQYATHLNLVYHWTKQSDEKSSGAFRDALLLFKVWLRQRGLDKKLNGFMVAMIMAWLHTSKCQSQLKLSSRWSAYQLFKVTMEWLSRQNFKTDPVLMLEQDNTIEGFETNQFVANFDAVLVDPSGTINLAGHLSEMDVKEIQTEALKAVSYLNDTNDDKFGALFLKKMDFATRFDNFCVIRSHSSRTKFYQLSHKLNFSSYQAFMNYNLPKYLFKALNGRCSLVTSAAAEYSSWPLNTSPPMGDLASLRIGFRLDVEKAHNIVEKGPSAEDKEACAQFRQIWGEKAELRRFKDGSILETIVWDLPENPSLEDRSGIVKQAVAYLLKHHIDILEPTDFYMVATDLLPLTRPITQVTAQTNYTQSINAFQPAMASFDEFVKVVRNLEELPLTLVEVRAAHSALRYASTFVPQPRSGSGSKIIPTVQDCILLFEVSSKWPSDFIAIQKVKAAFLIDLADRIESSWTGCTCSVVEGMTSEKDIEGISCEAAGYLDVFAPSGFTYRCRIYHHTEALMIERQLNDKNLLASKKEQLEYALDANRFRFYYVPQHTMYVQALVHRFPILSQIMRLAKRWVASHWLYAGSLESPFMFPNTWHIPEEVIELLCIKATLDSAPYDVPNSSWSGFVRFLELVATWNWKSDPMIVEMEEGSAKAEVCEKIQKHFDQHRQADPLGNRAAMFIVPVRNPTSLELETMSASATSAEASLLTSWWTQNGPKRVVLQRFCGLAKAAWKQIHAFDDLQTIDALSSQIMKLFNHATADYDVVIHLEPNLIPRYYENLHCDIKHLDFTETFKNLNPEAYADQASKLFNPVEFLIKELLQKFRDIAMFFYDGYGGTKIGVVFDPSICFTPRPFKDSMTFLNRPVEFDVITGKMVVPKKSEKSFKKPAVYVVANVMEMIAEIQTIGGTLISSVDVSPRIQNK